MLKSNPGEVEKLVAQLRAIVNASQLYPPEQLPRDISRSKARVAQTDIAQSGRNLGWINRQIDKLDQVTLVSAIKRFSDSLAEALRDPSRLEKVLSDMKHLTSVLERPFVR